MAEEQQQKSPKNYGFNDDELKSQVRMSPRMSALAVNLSKLDGKDLQEFDKDGDGKLSAKEISQLIDQYRDEEDKRRNYQVVAAVVLGLLAISICANLGTSWYAVAANKETKTTSAQAVPDELSVKANDTNASTTNTATEPPRLLTDMDGKVLRTDRSLDKMKLSSELPDETWSNLEEVHVQGTGGKIHFKVLGWARFDGERTRCGTVIVVYTVAGQIQFDGTAMTFSNDIAGAFSRAGFPVSSRRNTRQSDAGYTLTGIQEVFGAFKFVSMLDTSSLTCGDDVPNITNNPFVGLQNDFVLEESHLYSCGTADRPECPEETETITILGQSYYRRIKTTRARKIGNSWVWVARTVIPEAENSASVGITANVLVEMSNGTHVQSYTEVTLDNSTDTSQVICLWNRTMEKANTNPMPWNEDQSVPAEAEADDFTLYFVGYDVVNGEYVRHYTLTPKNQSYFDEPNVTVSQDTGVINMFESYEQNRLYSIGFFAPMKYATYDRIDVSPTTELQGDNMPALPSNASELSTWLELTDCVTTPFISEEDAIAMADSLKVADIARFNSIFPYTDEEAENMRLERAFYLDVELANADNSTNTTNGRFARDVDGEENYYSEDGDNGNNREAFRENIGEMMRNNQLLIEKEICSSISECSNLFGPPSQENTCCMSRQTCQKCMRIVNAMDTKALEHIQTDYHELHNISDDHLEKMRRQSLSYTIGCQYPKSIKSGSLWSGSPIRYYLDICQAPSRYVYKTQILSSCRSGCSGCKAYYLDIPFFYMFLGYQQTCRVQEAGKFISLSAGLKAAYCFPGLCGNPKVSITTDIGIKIDTVNLQENKGGGEVEIKAEFRILGKTISMGAFGSMYVYAFPFHLKATVGKSIGCCGISGKFSIYFTWTPPGPLPRPPNGFGAEAEGCLGWGFFKICGSIDIPLKI